MRAVLLAADDSACASMVELTISCRNLPNMDVFSKSDPICFAFLKDPTRQFWKEVGRTEIIWDNLDPEFSKKIMLPYLFEERQLLKFEIYDVDSPDLDDREKHDFIGRIEATLGEIVASAGLKAFERQLLNDHRKTGSSGTIKILAEEVSSFKDEFEFKLAAKNFHKDNNKQRGGGFFSRKQAYFFEIHKMTENAGLTLVYRSATVKESWQKRRNYVEWAPFSLSAYSLCNGDLDRNVAVSLWRYKWTGGHKLIGEFNTTIRTFPTTPGSELKLSGQASFDVLNFSRSSHSSFLDFVRIGRVQMNCFVAVDFTSSNGDPTQPNSLHYIYGTQPNHYETALRSVLEIIQDYDSDKLFPALGFGAKVPTSPDFSPTNLQLSHEFFLNFHPTNPYCEGVEGVMAAYRQALTRIRLHGPTNFSPVINHVSRFASANRDGRNYFILLIVTDGIICDLPQTINAIVAASSLPLSIIIVGVGDADFSAMDVLDADETPLVDVVNGLRMERDIVQFVPFNEILRRPSANLSNNNMMLAQVELAREILAELPRQFLSYMKKIGATAEKLAHMPGNQDIS